MPVATKSRWLLKTRLTRRNRVCRGFRVNHSMQNRIFEVGEKVLVSNNKRLYNNKRLKNNLPPLYSQTLKHMFSLRGWWSIRKTSNTHLTSIIPYVIQNSMHRHAAIFTVRDAVHRERPSYRFLSRTVHSSTRRECASMGTPS